MTKIEKIVLEHTRLALKYASFPANGGNTPEEAAAIKTRKDEIQARIKELRAEREQEVEQ